MPVALYLKNYCHYGRMECFASIMSSGGRVRWLWYFRFAHTACMPERPSAYADINRADRFAYLRDPEVSERGIGGFQRQRTFESGEEGYHRGMQ